MFRAVSDRPQWESLLPEELPRVDALLEDPAFFDPGRDALPSGDRPAVHTDRVLPAGDVLEGGDIPGHHPDLTARVQEPTG